jgi:hypothetical protein
MCSFAHDRYRLAAQAEAEALPEESIAKMSFRVRLMFSAWIASSNSLVDYPNDAPRNSNRRLPDS